MALVVIGGAVLDVQAHPAESDVRRGGSVPGRVRQVPGGVGRNIAEAASYLLAFDGDSGSLRRGSRRRERGGGGGSDQGGSGGSGDGSGSGSGGGGSGTSSSGVMLITVLGDDPAGDTLAAHCASLGFPAAGLLRAPGAATPTVSIIFDQSGEVAASVADVAALEAHLSPAALSKFESEIRAAKLLVIDGNLSPAAGAAAAGAAAAAGVPVLFEPISAPKAVRCVPILRHLTYITPNADELLAIAAALQRPGGGGSSGGGSSSGGSGGGGGGGRESAEQALARLAPAAAAVLAAGVRCILLTLGEAGAALLTLERSGGGGGGVSAGGSSGRARVALGSSSGGSSGGGGRLQLVAAHIPAAPATVTSVSGAGDCLAAGFAAALARGAPPEVALAEGSLAARAAVESESNVPPPGALVSAARDVGAVGRQLAALRVLRFPVAAAL